MKVIIALLGLLAIASADLYMMNPRGNNDRLNEANANRNNANRLFDSQNNAKGGFCYGPAMEYYAGSQLTVEWTNQHACGNPKLFCNLVLQYMCGFKDDPDMINIRDGTTTDRIPDAVDAPTTKNANGEYVFGMNEPYEYYQDCKTRDRNMGLYIADRESEGGLTPGRRSSIFTRQNNNGNRHGYECTEERDYYPYWAWSPWRDIAILTHDTQWCDYYQDESQNVKERHYCHEAGNPDVTEQYNNEIECKQNGAEWGTKDAWDIPAPECVKAPWSRHNHLGNGMNGFTNNYNWTLPSEDEEACIEEDNCNCIFRMRYNISTYETGGENGYETFIDWTQNEEASPAKQDQILMQSDQPHQLALNTNQFGRTFQDRSYVFHIKPRPDGVGASRIFNLNVRGKRGNIVQTYPATEYDFVPSYLTARVGDYIHFQWTGCDTNPAGNAGEGTDQTDRSNMVQIEDFKASHPATDKWIDENTPLFEEKELRMRMAYLDQTNCLTYEELDAKNNGNQNDIEQDVQNCMKMNAAALPYFDGGLIKMNLTGDFHYMSTRNNNFTNRGQKGAITIENLLPTWAIVIVVIGVVLFVGSGGIAGAMLYAKSHPHSGVATIFSKI